MIFILRPMNMDDTGFMLELKNYPETRRFAIQSHKEIRLEDHWKWLSRNVKYFQVIEGREKNRLGAVRIHLNEVSIWVNRAYWGKGIATDVLNKISKPGLLARIVDGNIASFKAFVRAGFEPIQHKKNYYILRRK